MYAHAIKSGERYLRTGERHHAYLCTPKYRAWDTEHTRKQIHSRDLRNFLPEVVENWAKSMEKWEALDDQLDLRRHGGPGIVHQFCHDWCNTVGAKARGERGSMLEE
ncbi:hypothetical protein RSAG8_03935, partial [Rhizoctonia solani AG-8 WAC10335]